MYKRQTLSQKGKALSLSDIQQIYQSRYRDENFVKIMHEEMHPDIRSVRGNNECRISIHRPQGGDTLVILAVEDNLVKGAAGQAIQNMNLLFGLDENSGLESIALVP